MHTEEIGALVLDSAMKVHSALGPGLLESAYRACLAHELEMRGLDVSQEKPLPIKDGINRVVNGLRGFPSRPSRFRIG